MQEKQNSEKLVLAVDTTQPQLAVAIARGEKLLARKTDESGEPHSQRLFVCLEELLLELALTIYDIDLFAVNVGPGSFTGLRVGIAAVQGMASTLKKPLIGINAIDANAFLVAAQEKKIVVILNASRAEVFAGVRSYDASNYLINPEPDFSLPIAEIPAAMLKRFVNVPVRFVGSGAATHWASLQSENLDWTLETPLIEVVDAMALNALRLFNARPSQYPASAYYIRPSEAELKYKS